MEYKIISAAWMTELEEDLETLHADGWRPILMGGTHGYLNILLQRPINGT